MKVCWFIYDESWELTPNEVFVVIPFVEQRKVKVVASKSILLPSLDCRISEHFYILAEYSAHIYIYSLYSSEYTQIHCMSI